jgi:hypothetical protein
MGILKDHWIEHYDPLSPIAGAESGYLMQLFKHAAVTPVIREEATAWPAEFEQAIHEVEAGLDSSSAGSLVDLTLKEERKN